MKKLLTLHSLVLLVLICGLLAGQTATAQSTSGDGIEPQFVSGNPSCQTLGYAYGFKVDGSADGTYFFTSTDGELTGNTPEDGANSITISNSDGIYFDWASTLGIDLMIVKGGPNANAYYYDPEDFGDTALHSPINSDNGTPFGISHIEVCYDYELNIEKDAHTSFTRTYEWDITKDVTPAAWDLFVGDSGTSEYEITVNRTGYQDSKWTVSGSITIGNNTPFTTTIESITDEISGYGTVDIECNGDYTLAPGETLTCTYTTGDNYLPDGTNRTNTVTVTTPPGSPVDGGTATANVVFDGNTIINEVNATVDVEDVNDLSGTQYWYDLVDGQTVTYEQQFFCGGNEGMIHNVATILQTEDWDEAWVTVNCYAPEVTKNANTSFTRTYEWDITKEVTPASWDLFVGDKGTSLYTVEVTQTGYDDSNWAVNGTITITNPAPIDAVINSVSDVISPDIAANVVCRMDGSVVTIPYTLAAGGTMECTYSAEADPGALTNPFGTLNTATATLQNSNYDANGNATPGGTTSFDGTATVDFSDNPVITPVDQTVTVTDTYEGTLGTGTATDETPYSTETFTYERTFECGGDEGTFDNTATIDTEPPQSASASVTVNCYDLTVTKDANTELTRTYDWTIEKLCYNTIDSDPLNGFYVGLITLSPGQILEGGATYEVTVDATYTDSEWKVYGDITITNTAPIDAEINSLSDVVSAMGYPDITVVPDCGVTFPYTLLAGTTLNCTYETSLSDDATRTNTATAVQQNFNYRWDGNDTEQGTTFYSAEVTVDFSTAEIIDVDECIYVTDSYDNMVDNLGTVCYPNVPHTFTYTRDVGPYDVCGTYFLENVASFAANDTPTKTGFDDCTITVEVPCDGCTLTPGYWKTHSINGPAPYDDTWAHFDPDGDDIYATFFLSGQTYYDVLWTAPAGGNAYYILAHAYIAAELNFLNGADPSAAQFYFDQATGYLETYTPAEMGAWKGKDKDLRNAVIALAYELDRYNNGLTGPGHCTEEEMEDSGYDAFESGQTLLSMEDYKFNGYYLGQNIPNPFTGTTIIEFVLPEDSYARITLFNLNGQQVTDLVNGYYQAGEHRIEWNAPADLSPGVYFYRLQTPDKVLTRKMNLLR